MHKTECLNRVLTCGVNQCGKALVMIKATALCVAISCTATLAQVGPEIPPVDQRSIISESESVRPAVDAILLEQARLRNDSQPTAHDSIETNTVENDLNSAVLVDSNSTPLGQPAEPTRLLGASSSESIDKGRALTEGFTQTVLSLLGVILLILGLGQLYKRLAKSQGGLAGQLGAGGSAPTGIIEIIGRYPLSKGMTLVVLKFDRKVLLLSQSTSGKKQGKNSTLHTLCELTDPEDVASVLLKARDASGDSIARTFEQTLREADGITDEYLHDIDQSYAEQPIVQFPANRTEPSRTITTDEGDRVDLWSSGQQAPASTNVLRQRLSRVRRGQQG